MKPFLTEPTILKMLELLILKCFATGHNLEKTFGQDVPDQPVGLKERHSVVLRRSCSMPFLYRAHKVRIVRLCVLLCIQTGVYGGFLDSLQILLRMFYRPLIERPGRIESDMRRYPCLSLSGSPAKPFRHSGRPDHGPLGKRCGQRRRIRWIANNRRP